MPIRLFEEHPGLEDAIRRVVADAFGRDDESRLVDDLRRSGDLAISLVAEEAGETCGHVALSRLESPSLGLALAPVSVRKSSQGAGVGTALVRDAIDRAQAAGYAIIFVLGEPAFYQRFGFSTDTAAAYPCAFSGPHFMALRLSHTPVAAAPVVYADAFRSLA
jgi:putative acetyltransferase